MDSHTKLMFAYPEEELIDDHLLLGMVFHNRSRQLVIHCRASPKEYICILAGVFIKIETGPSRWSSALLLESGSAEALSVPPAYVVGTGVVPLR